MWLVRDISMVILSNLVFLILLVLSLVDEFMLMPLYHCRIWVAENLKVLGQRRGDLLGVVKVTFLIYLSVLEKYDGELDYMFLSLSLSIHTHTHTEACTRACALTVYSIFNLGGKAYLHYYRFSQMKVFGHIIHCNLV